MIAVAKDFFADVGEIEINVGGRRAVAAIGLEEFVPQHQAITVAQIVEIVAGALADPVAEHDEIGFLLKADLGFEALARTAFEGLVQSPAAALAEDADAVDRESEELRVGHFVLDFANAEIEIVFVGNRAADHLKPQPHGVEIGFAIAVGPPEARVEDMQPRRVLRRKLDNLGFVGRAGRRPS